MTDYQSVVEALRSRLELSMAQAAELFDVRRSTVYDWLDGVAPSPTKAVLIDVLHALVAEMPSTYPLERLKMLWRMPLDGTSFLDIVHADELRPQYRLVRLRTKLQQLTPRLETPPAPLRPRSATAFRGEIDIGPWTSLD